MSTDQPTSGQLASFDQTHAAWSASLDNVIDAYRCELADGQSREISMAGLSQWLSATMATVALAEHLAVAVARLLEAHAAPAAAFRDGEAEGRRQATEGWEREWSLNGPAFSGLVGDEQRVRQWAATNPELAVVSRLVGPWEPAEQAPAVSPRSARGLMVGNGMRRVPGNETIALNCDECGELECEHRCPKHGRGLPCRTCDEPAPAEGEALGVTDEQAGDGR
jgi:hypothetical protein